MGQAAQIKKTPIYDSHVRLGGRMVEFAGYWLPVQYTKMLDEHLQVRQAGGLFDVSHMARFHVRGAGARAFCRRLAVNNANKLTPGRGQYSVLCNPNGGAIDDVTLFCLADNHFQWIVNASRRHEVWEWMNAQLEDGGKTAAKNAIELMDQTDATALLAIQGPKVAALMESLTQQSLQNLKLFHCSTAKLFNLPITLFRSGYTGEDGFEIQCAATSAQSLWDQLLAAAGPKTLTPIGLGARDSLRLEMGYMLYGHELNEKVSPLEAGLSWVVKLDDDDFIGKSVLLKQREQGLSRSLIGVVGSAKEIPRAGYALFSHGKQVGELTSGGYSPCLKKGLGLGYVATEVARSPKLEMSLRGEKIQVDVVKPPFITINR